jgi:hypothetical protein
MPIEGRGWELHVDRFRVDPGGDRRRTVSKYQVYRDGVPVEGLSGLICECEGPGNNDKPRSSKRMLPGRYGLYVHGNSRTRYRTVDYAASGSSTARPKPGFLLLPTGRRGPILVHPAHPPHLYLSSIGCLNPTRAIRPREDMTYSDSRQRVIDMIDDLTRFAGGLKRTGPSRIDGAWAVIDGEPA